jgi:hypothetical protein
VARILEVRRRTPALRRGRQYLREISGDGVNFGQPSPIGGQLRSVVAWSRLFADSEVLAAINTDPLLPQTAWVTVDAGLQKDKMTCRYSTDRTQEDETVPVENHNGRAVRLTVPPAGFVIYD